MPEEVNRVVTDRVSDFLFAPSADAVDNLRAEGYDAARIHLVGNVMVDSLLANEERARSRPILARLGVRPGGYGLVTLHRPANVDDPDMLEILVGALAAVAADSSPSATSTSWPWRHRPVSCSPIREGCRRRPLFSGSLASPCGTPPNDRSQSRKAPTPWSVATRRGSCPRPAGSSATESLPAARRCGTVRPARGSRRC